MALFKQAEMASAYLKMGLLGFAGAGKTYTASKTAIGLLDHMRKAKMPLADKPIFFLDTETGSDFVKGEIEAAGNKLYTAKTRAFSDLMLALNEAEKEASLLLIDSVTHFWTELCESYAKKKNRTRGLEFQDWAYLKKEWRRFTDAFVNSNLHVIICGRAGFEYDYFEDSSGKKQLEKSGIKMKAETEFGYEPSLLVLMEREKTLDMKKPVRTAQVLKDRSRLIDGKAFANPSFKDFAPHILFLNIGGAHVGVDTTRNSERDIPADADRDKNKIYRRIVIDEIESLLVMHFPGQTSDEKRTKKELIREHFKASWTEIEELMPLESLRAGYDSLHRKLERKPSRYGADELDDEIPDSNAKNSSAPAGTVQDQPAEPEAQVALSEASGASAPSDSPNPAGQDGADASDASDKIKDAVAQGREARRNNLPRTVPNGLHYKSRADQAAAFMRGWDDENAKMNVEEYGVAG